MVGKFGGREGGGSIAGLDDVNVDVIDARFNLGLIKSICEFILMVKSTIRIQTFIFICFLIILNSITSRDLIYQFLYFTGIYVFIRLKVQVTSIFIYF